MASGQCDPLITVVLMIAALFSGVVHTVGKADPLLPKELVPPNEQRCDLFSGEWVTDPSGPPYANGSCHFIREGQNCMSNGRPDTEYLHWRWKPYGCDLLRFDPKKFLISMEHKVLGAIGDSLIRNQIESLVCILSQVEDSVIYEEIPSQSLQRWYFPTNNFTVTYISSSFLLKSYKTIGRFGYPAFEIHLDALDSNWTSMYHTFDHVVISVGAWFIWYPTVYFENSMILGSHDYPESNLTELGVLYPYGRALDLAFRFITGADHKPFVIYRSHVSDHFEHGSFAEGGYCNRTRPFQEGEYAGDALQNAMYVAGNTLSATARASGSKNGVSMEVLDVYHLSLLRPDGHPNKYDGPIPKRGNDCLHWCLPGPIDTWNYLMAEMISRNIIGSPTKYSS